MPPLIEFPADDADRATAFWSGLLDLSLAPREAGQGQGWQGDVGGATLGIHPRGAGPGDRFSLPYFAVADLPAALARVVQLGGEVVHPGERWAVCKDSEGTPFGLGADPI